MRDEYLSLKTSQTWKLEDWEKNEITTGACPKRSSSIVNTFYINTDEKLKRLSKFTAYQYLEVGTPPLASQTKGKP